MKRITRQSYVPYSAEQMYELVDDIEKYPEFIPWCSGAGVLKRDENEVTATLCLSKMGVKKDFTTKNTLSPHHEIKIDLVNGPFKSLSGDWKFEEINGEGSKVMLDLSYETKGIWLDVAFGKVFDYVANHMVEAFCKRAKEVYID